MIKKLYSLCFAAFLCVAQGMAQGWPSNYGGVMLQGFSWDSYVDSQWSNLESQADELSEYFSLIWVPQSGNCNSSYNVMGYTPVYYFDQNSSFGTEAQLRSMIASFKEKGLGVIADVVINHRNNLGVDGSWVDYPEETYGGVTYQMLSTDIVADDDDGETKAWADANGYSLSANDDEGEDWSGCRDLDHKSDNVQKCVKAYVKYLVDDLGYTGFRYDMVKGFDASHVADYNDEAGVDYSVGEYWDGNSAIESWINSTGKKSAAFDFQFRYNVRDAINANDWTNLNSTNNLIHDADYRRYAVTFIENHDTQDRGTSDGYTADPISTNIEAGNAYLLAMPGTPCVFLTHWKNYKDEIKAMINARKVAGIHNESTYENVTSTGMTFQNSVQGTNGRLLVSVGVQNSTPDASTWVKVLGGTKYAYYLSRDTEVAWVDVASGTFTEAFDVTLTAVSTTSDACLVYTLDGSDPTANSTVVASGSSLTIDASCTLKVALLKDGNVSGVISREYTIEPFEAHTATIYLKDPNWTNVYFYAWDDDASLLGSWPGTKITATTVIDGSTWYYHAFDINSADYTFNIIFDQGSGLMQTVDIGPLSEDTYYEISDVSNGKYTVTDVTDEVTTTGIEDVMLEKVQSDDKRFYDLKGIQTETPSRKGVYIHQGKKIVVR